jgi:gliding motility-associated-like protein
VITGNQPLTYAWTNSTQTTSDISDLTPGSYGLTVTDAQGCSTSFGPVVLTAPIEPNASFIWSPQEPTENSQVVFTDNSNGTIVNYSWSINGQSFTGEQVEYTVIEGEYTIQLTVTDDNGCSDTYTITLPVFDGLTIPNVMTLNNDGVNDFFLIEGLKSETSLTILNRWGEIVFSTNNYQNDWNGKDQSGALLTEGVYTYVLNAPNDKLKHGFIHLVR